MNNIIKGIFTTNLSNQYRLSFYWRISEGFIGGSSVDICQLAKVQLTFVNGESPICENLLGEVPVTQLDSKCTFCLFRSHSHSLLTFVCLFRFIMFAFIVHFHHTVKLKISRPLVKTLPISPIVSLLHIRSSPIGLKILVAPLVLLTSQHYSVVR